MFFGKNNRYPYLILLIIHSTLLLYTFAKVKNKKPLVVLLLSNMGLAYLFEYLILSFLHLYRYKPNFFKKKFLDDISGAILSQAVYVPFTALFITAFKLKWPVKMGFAIYFALIEKLFIKMGIFKKRGWKTRYTLVLIYLYFHVSDQWLRLLKKGNSIIQKFTLYNMVQFTGINSLVTLEMLHLLSFGRGKHHSLMEQHKMETSYSSIMSAIKTSFAYTESVAVKIGLLSVKNIIDRALRNMKLINIKSIFPITLIDVLLLSLGPVYKKWIEDIALSDGPNTQTDQEANGSR
ncbi:hypothetical protein DS745_22745 [Anaerobacillus alkaliphilus]|uniref:Uncharacterized protein n=1 Tax=Anaerobacillus alkaliphilus TaxID=1548597 RepID=A0A4Q0VNT2_9BACI|nr:hypothetical protein [Anaerobacillus alkaliphilus]RXI96530.1 hypothetical protein DS745_22745 [Anaerobacillus alkaliphilus]